MTISGVTDAVVNLQTGGDKLVVMRRLVEVSELADCLRRAQRKANKPPEGFGVVIKVDVATDPELVDALVEAIRSFGYGPVTVPGDWLDADFRISFGKVRTSKSHFYDACISNVSQDLPVELPRHANGLRQTRFERDVKFADEVPVHFGFADAWAMRTLICAENLLALDWVVGEKMGLDPSLNPVVQEAMYRWGTFHLIRLGNTTPWAGWKNVSAGVVVWNQLFNKDL